MRHEKFIDVKFCQIFAIDNGAHGKHPEIKISNDPDGRNLELVISLNWLEFVYEDHTLARIAKHWTCEELLKGSFSKYINNSGGLVADTKQTEARQVANTFAHYTWYKSGRELMATDLQGVGTNFTDCANASVRGNDYGNGDQGMPAVEKLVLSPWVQQVVWTNGLALQCWSGEE